MMTLAQAASFFDRTPVMDADTGKLLFRGQVDPYDDSKRDAGAAYRRILSVAPGTVIPASRAVTFFGSTWLIGASETDGLAQAHRDKHVLMPTEGKATVHRLSAFVAAGSAAATPWVGVEWLKNAKQLESSSRRETIVQVFLPLNTDVRDSDVVSCAGQPYLVIEQREQPSGYRVAEALRLDQTAPATASITRRAYVPGTGFSASSPVTAQCLQVPWQYLFEYNGQLDPRFQEGDCALVLPAATSIDSDDKISFGGTVWQPVEVDTLAGAVVVHARRSV